MDVTTTSSTDLALRQVAAIDAFLEALRAARTVAGGRGGSREARLDTARRLDVLQRQHDALVAATDRALRSDDRSGGRPRALVAHRNAWFRDRAAQELAGQGISVLGLLDNGADAVGAVVADQPDLVLLEDPLPMMTTDQVVREVLRWSPRTLLAVQTADSSSAPALHAAGVRSVFGRQVPPAEVAHGLAAALLAEPHRLVVTG